jgi:deoxyribonuclease-4
MYIGAHVSISKGFSKAVKAAQDIDANTLQFFTRNPRGGKAKKLDENDIQKYKKLITDLKFGQVVAHAPYTLNMASPKQEARDFALSILSDDINRLERLNVKYLCIHPGSHVGSGIKEGIKRISALLNTIFESTDSNVIILLETMSGSGTEIGGTFEELSEIINKIRYQERIGVCFDTCHVFSAGYNIQDSLESVLELFEQQIGISKIKAFHLNNSLNPLGSKKDRHAGIGEGVIGKNLFIKLVQMEKFKDHPFILETPGGMEGYAKEIRLLRFAEL